MKEEGIIKAEKRTHASGGANKRARAEGYLPGNIFGKAMESVPVTVTRDDLGKSLKKFGRNAVFKVDVTDDKAYDVVIREIQSHPVSGILLHVDFQQINLKEEMKTDVLIKLIGDESLNSKQLNVLMHMDNIMVKGLPQAIPESIEIDVTKLHSGDSLTIADVKFPKGIVCELDPETIVLSVKASILQELLEESDAAAEAKAEAEAPVEAAKE
jgi:large subunit ribosomal protein L25